METIRRLLLLLFAPEKLPHLKGRSFQIDDEGDVFKKKTNRPDSYAELGLETPHLFSEDD